MSGTVTTSTYPCSHCVMFFDTIEEFAIHKRDECQVDGIVIPTVNGSTMAINGVEYVITQATNSIVLTPYVNEAELRPLHNLPEEPRPTSLIHRSGRTIGSHYSSIDSFVKGHRLHRNWHPYESKIASSRR